MLNIIENVAVYKSESLNSVDSLSVIADCSFARLPNYQYQKILNF